MPVARASTLTLLLFLPVIHGCALARDADPGIGAALAKIGEINLVGCPELDRGDVATIRAKPTARPWTAESGASTRQLQAQVDKQDLQLEAKRLAGERVIAEHDKCRGAVPEAGEKRAPDPRKVVPVS